MLSYTELFLKLEKQLDDSRTPTQFLNLKNSTK